MSTATPISDYLGDYDEQEQSAIQISFDLSMEESFNLKKGSVDDSQNSKRSRKDQMGSELGDSMERAFKGQASSFMEESMYIEQKDTPVIPQENPYNHPQSAPLKPKYHSNRSLHQSPPPNPPPTAAFNILDSELSGTFGSLDSQRSTLKGSAGNTLDAKRVSLQYTNKTFRPIPEQIVEVQEEYVGSGFKIMVSKEKKSNPETQINDSIKLEGSANLGQAFRTTACFSSDPNIKISKPQKSPIFSSNTISSRPSNTTIGNSPKLPPNPNPKNFLSLSPDQNKASLKKCMSAESITPNFVKKMSLRDYMQLNKLSGSRRNRAKQIIQTASTRETNQQLSDNGSRRKLMNSPSNIEFKIKEDITNNITKVQKSLQRTLQFLEQAKCNEVNQQESIMALYNLNRLLKDKLTKANSEISQFLDYHENAFAS